jgi:hypothetical protein
VEHLWELAWVRLELEILRSAQLRSSLTATEQARLEELSRREQELLRVARRATGQGAGPP